MPPESSRTGADGERIAAAHLEAQGLVVVERNFRTRYGEIDLVAHDGDDVVFVEVKTRRSGGFGAPAEAVTPRKQERLMLAALEYLHERGLEERAWRIDVVAILLARSGPADITHIRSAVEEG